MLPNCLSLLGFYNGNFKYCATSQGGRGVHQKLTFPHKGWRGAGGGGNGKYSLDHYHALGGGEGRSINDQLITLLNFDL